MSISSSATRKTAATGNGATTAFPFSFKVFQASDLLVVQTDLNATDTTLALTTNYSVALNANQDSNPGGTVNMLVAPPNGYVVTIGSNVPQTQSLTLTNNSGFYPTVINDALDRMVILVQQLSEVAGRSLRLPFSASSNVSAQLPAVLPGSLIGWNATGTGLANAGGTGVAPGAILAANIAPAAAGTALSADTQAAATKATPADADRIPLFDSTSFFSLKGLTWANIKGIFLLQNNPTLGLVETFADPAGARCRRYYDTAGIPGLLYNGVGINAEYMTVNNTSITVGAWAGRDVAGPCWAEVMTDAGQKLYYYAPTAAAGTAPVWSYAFGWDLSNGAAKGLPAGTPLMWPLLAVPSWALVRDGSAISRTAYANLFAALCPVRYGTTTNASNVVTGLSTTVDLYVGMPIEGAGIPAGTTIASITSVTAITLSANATASGTALVQTFNYGYGSGGGATTFGVPDDRGAFERGLDSGGAARDVLAYSCTNTSGQALLTGLSSTTGMSVGMALSGTGVPGGATIAQINSATSIAMSAISTAAVTGITVTGNRIGAYSVDQLAPHMHTSFTMYGTYGSTGGSGNTVTTGGVTGSTGNTETKPKNRAYLPIIVY